MDIDKSTATNARKRRNFQVSLVFQEKVYSQIGPATAQIREQLFKDLANDRAEEIARLPNEIYYTQSTIEQITCRRHFFCFYSEKFLPSQDKDQSIENERVSEERIDQDDYKVNISKEKSTNILVSSRRSIRFFAMFIRNPMNFDVNNDSIRPSLDEPFERRTRSFVIFARS